MLSTQCTLNGSLMRPNNFSININYPGELAKVKDNWVDSDEYEGQCVKKLNQQISRTPDVETKKFLDYASNERLCFFICQEARRQPRRPDRASPLAKPWMTGCEFDASGYSCYSHISTGLNEGNGQTGSKCVIYKTWLEEPGECVRYGWQSGWESRRIGIGMVGGIGNGKKYRHRYRGVNEPRGCLSRCLEEHARNRTERDSWERISGCEFKRLAGRTGICEAIREKFEGGSLEPNPEGTTLSEGRLTLCWKFFEPRLKRKLFTQDEVDKRFIRIG